MSFGRPVSLSWGAIERIKNGHLEENAVLQVLGHREIPGHRENMFRMVLNDGEQLFAHAVLAGHLCQLIHQERLQKYTVFRLKSYELNKLENGSCVIVCTGIEIVAYGSEVNCRIQKLPARGVKVENGSASSSSANNQASRGGASTSSNIEKGNYSTSKNAGGTSLCLPSSVEMGHDFCVSIKTENNQNNFEAACLNSVNTTNHVIAREKMKHLSHSSTKINQLSSPVKIEGMTLNSNSSCLNNHTKSDSEAALHTSLKKNYGNQTAACSTATRACEHALNRSNSIASQGNIRDNLCSIADISPYYNKWAVRAFVYHKTPLNSFSNPRSSGKFFAFHLRDDSGEIKATAFNAVAEKIFDSVQLFKTYLVSKATVKIAREGSSCKGNFELIVEENTLIQQDEEACSSELSSLFNFHTFEEIESFPKGTYTDIIAICTGVSDISEVVTKLNRETVKRNLTLFDRSGRSITITIWNSHAKNYDFKDDRVIAIKNAKIIGYNATTISLDTTSLIYIDPPIKETDLIKSWFHDLPSSSQPQKTLSYHLPDAQTYRAFKEITTDNEDMNWPIYYKTKATIIMVNREKCMYQACPTVGCMKKVIDCNNGTYRCNKCNFDFKAFNWVLFLQLELADYSESRWTVAFREIAEDLIGKSSQELSRIKDEDPECLQDILNNLNLKSYIFDLRSHVEKFNDNIQLKTSIINFHPIDIPVYAKKLLVDIQRYHSILLQM